MHFRKLALVIFSVVISLCATICPCIATGPIKYDMALLPISADKLRQQLRAYPHDAVALCQLIRQSGNNNLDDVAYNTLKSMMKAQPKNAVVQAAYCYAYETTSGEYMQPPFTNHNSGRNDYKLYKQALATAYQLDPSLWLTYLVDGYERVLIPDRIGLGEGKRGLTLLMKAVRLAPQLSITHSFLGRAYTVFDTGFQSYPKAAAQFSKAIELEPVSAPAAAHLFTIYEARTPDFAKARQALHQYLISVPPGYRLSAHQKEIVAQYGLTETMTPAAGN